MRVRNRLLILVLSVLIPAFAASALATWYVYREEKKAQEKGLVEAARAFALLVESQLRAREGILRALAGSPSLARWNLAEFHAHAKSMSPTPETAIVLVDREGRQLLNTRAPPGTELPSRRFSNLQELMRQSGPDTTLVSDVFVAPLGKRYNFAVQVPVGSGNDISHYLVMGVNASALKPLLMQQHLPDQWIATIVDRQGIVVSRSRDPEQYIGKQVREYTRRILGAEREGMYSSVTLDGIPARAFFSRVPIADWSVLISIPESEVRRTATQAAAFLAGIMVLLLALAVVTARRVARRVIRPIEQLGATAEKLGQGEEVSYVPQGLQEVDAVGAQMAGASSKIWRAKLELEQRVAEAIAATERAQRALLQNQKLEALGRLTGGIAHEFNNLLQTLTTALQLAKFSSNQERVQSLIETCQKAVERATALTGQLGSFGRVQDARLVTVVPDEQIKSFQQLIKGILPSNIALRLRLEERLWPVTVDLLQLELALLNVAINGRDAMPAGGTLTIEAANLVLDPAPDGLPAGDYVRIRIADTGTGMAPAVLAKALDPFFTTKAVGKGTGLGLPQAYGFARQSRGTLVLGSAEGEGTTVEIYLPRAAGPVSEPVPPADRTAHAPAAQGAVLFVEDDALVREAVVPALEKSGFTVLTAGTADEALAMLESGAEVDVVFSDIVMPGKLGGIDLAGIVRDRFPAIRVILATGYTDRRVAIAGVELLAKPYEIADAVQVLSDAVADPAR